MKKYIFYLIAANIFLAACKEDIDTSARYVFKEDTIVDYLRKHSDSYSMYTDLLFKVPVSTLSETTVGQLLSARGHYTVFAPTNDAIQAYLDTLAASSEDYYITTPSWDAFTDSTKLDSIRKTIVLNSIIDSGDDGFPYMTCDFPRENGGEFGYVNMNDKKLSVYYTGSPDSIFINKNCIVNLKNRDIITLNGYIHQMEQVIAPGNLSASYYLQNIIEMQKEGFLVMARAIEACGLLDTLNAMRDEVYEDMYQKGLFKSWDNDNGRFIINPPKHRLYGFTIFAATDDFWRAQGMDPTAPDLMSQLMQWIQDQHQYSNDDVYTTDENYRNPENLLYQWTTYHMLPMRVPSDKLIIHNESFTSSFTPTSPVPVTDYFITFGKRRLIKVYESRLSSGICLNRFPKLDNGRTGTGGELECDPDKEGIHVNVTDPRAVMSDISNCCIYPIDRPLAYDDATRDNLLRERIRVDVMSMLPETMTNDIRCKKLTHSTLTDENFCTFPPHETYDYCQDMMLSVESRPRYSNYSGTTVMFGDELLIYGNYDVTFRLPPVPRTSTYEIRLGYIAQYNRGTAQFYLGTDLDRLPVTGIPLDMTRMGENLSGYESDSQDQDYNAELDKRMRNYGLMKGPLTIPNCRNDIRWIRTIVATTTITPDKDYYLKMKSVIDSEERQGVIDFFELCPKEIYDNPNEPEDIW